jgi:hypothetical protein
MNVTYLVVDIIGFTTWTYKFLGGIWKNTIGVLYYLYYL